MTPTGGQSPGSVQSDQIHWHHRSTSDPAWEAVTGTGQGSQGSYSDQVVGLLVGDWDEEVSVDGRRS